MTIDKANLKALAEAAPYKDWSLSSYEAVGGRAHIVMHGAFGHIITTFEEGSAEFIAAASPATVLALLAEIERLATSRSKKERELEQELEVWHHGPFCWTCGDTGDVHDITGEWRGECDCLSAQLINANRERDQLKAENEALRKVLSECIQSLSEEMLSKYHQAPEYMHPSTKRRYDLEMEELAGYRAAMAKESSHD